MAKARGHYKRAAAVVLGTGLWLIFLVAPQAGVAAAHCRQNPDGTVLSISSTGKTFAGVRRSGDKIGVFDVIAHKQRCESESTVTELERIKVFAGSSAAIEIELRKGPFAPGLGGEDTSPEIEIEASGPGYVDVVGGPGPDHFQFMNEGQESGINLNPDEDRDLDVVVAPQDRKDMLFVVDGGGGNDRIDALGSPLLEMFAGGGDGNDTLVAAANGAILEGERGADKLIGGPAVDYMVPGRGPDEVRADGGSDLVEMRPDGSRDRIDCGSGFDLVSPADPFDHLVSCP